MVFSQGPKWHLLSLLFACLAVQVLSQSSSGTECHKSTPGCEPPKFKDDSKSLEPQTCSGASSKQRYIGLYDYGILTRDCDNLEPWDINVEPWTHLFMSFNAFPLNYSGVVAPGVLARKSWQAVTGLKIRKPSLKAYVSVGHSPIDGNPWRDVASSFENRKYFIDSFAKIMEEFKFDGLNLDLTWTYWPDYSPDEAKNLITLLKELRESFGDKYGLSATMEATECGLKGYDLPGMAEQLDFLNFLPYDVTNDCAPEVVQELPRDTAFAVERSLRLFQQANIDPNKLSLMLPPRGGIYRLADPKKCHTPNCPMGGSVFGEKKIEEPFPGECSQSSGSLTSYETERLIRRWSPEVHYNQSGAYSWFVFSDNHLVVFKNAESWKQLADLANKHCVGGLFVWDISDGGPATLANPNDLDPFDTSMRGARLTNPYNGTNGYSYISNMPSATSIQSDSLSTETSNNDTDINANMESLSCHPAIGSVHVPIAQQDCDSNSTTTASHNPDTLVNAEEYTPSPTLAAPHEASTSDEPNAMGPKPTLTLAHRIGTPSNTAEKANGEGITAGEPTNAP
ncbi:glycoside hydrolase superfamily [Aspergillus sergii]|uniref:chitinase n=1 Tax=Aspergillus sergii TaxID=1034303 RepID=A0A5N6WRY0_9EURO|nr:glycoside hydrolase superfamily [Aspergillus sergii]